MPGHPGLENNGCLNGQQRIETRDAKMIASRQCVGQAEFFHHRYQ